MSFDSKKFTRTKFTARTESVPVPDLQAFFPEGEKAVWTVRGLTGAEIGRAAEASDRNKNMAAILEGLLSEASKDRTDAVKDILGLGGVAPQDIAKRIEHLIIASVEPKCTSDMAVKLSEVFPVEFFQITNVIMVLTGKGQMPGKQPASGATEKSEPPSPSVTSEADSSLKPGRTPSRKAT
jgi:hypothetical protein